MVRDVEGFAELLSAFRQLPAPAKTLLEIAGYPQLENVCSNILKFYLDPREQHGLKDLVLRSLLASAEHDLEVLGNGRVDYVWREVLTSSGNRLDIVVVSENLVVGIENKIEARANNPFEDYSQRLTELANRKPPVKLVAKVLLSLHEEKMPLDLSGFRPVTYSGFFSRLLKDIGDYLPDVAPRYLGYLVDFVNTLRNLEKGVRPMDENFRHFISDQDHVETIGALEQKMKEFRAELRTRLEELVAAIPGKLPGGFQQTAFSSGIHEGDEGRFFYDFIGFSRPDIEVHVVAWAAGWIIYLSSGKTNRDLTSWIEENRVAQNADTRRIEHSTGRLIYDEFDYSTSPSIAAKAVRNLLDRISRKSA